MESQGTLITTGGERLRLAGVAWPDRLEPGAQLRLRAALLTHLEGHRLSFHADGPLNRWGERPAHVFVQEPDGALPPFWLQAGLAAAGLAPGWPDLAPGCWPLLLAHEREARRARRGFWAPRAQAARHAALSRAPGMQAGRAMVARWRVHSVRQAPVLTYVNIVPSLRAGPSLGLTGKEVDAMARRGLDVRGLGGRMIVARFLSGSSGLLRARLAEGEALMLDDE